MSAETPRFKSVQVCVQCAVTLMVSSQCLQVGTTLTLTHRQTLAMDLVGPTRIVTERFNAAVQINEKGLEEGLPRVQGLQGLESWKQVSQFNSMTTDNAV